MSEVEFRALSSDESALVTDVPPACGAVASGVAAATTGVGVAVGSFDAPVLGVEMADAEVAGVVDEELGAAAGVDASVAG
jgi:hypothetical protein